jgi:hypothetical protein
MQFDFGPMHFIRLKVAAAPRVNRPSLVFGPPARLVMQSSGSSSVECLKAFVRRRQRAEAEQPADPSTNHEP